MFRHTRRIAVRTIEPRNCVSNHSRRKKFTGVASKCRLLRRCVGIQSPRTTSRRFGEMFCATYSPFSTSV
ncbi:hypothetical protein LIPSTDRAFT_227542 [Lipomyces starkeyi NRRL Y-11557]|uniref:Uncharacterized protein n=1 Tax=Lipomyces starkeyi NRRL Y-11557 TaxID=675824 RepID=A0A1E3QAM0_LIPST|nr:hypothetical protein LIPSTDRAFT_227542 [Lipomyces starkeyi NRRL Y-11557]